MWVPARAALSVVLGPQADLPPALLSCRKPSPHPLWLDSTDTSKFTGSHKERFDPSGRGKGRGGRVDLVDGVGLRAGLQAGTSDQKVQGASSRRASCCRGPRHLHFVTFLCSPAELGPGAGPAGNPPPSRPALAPPGPSFGP